MSLASSPLDHAAAPVFADGLGERVVAADATTGELLQILRLRPALTAVPSFEFALRERTARLVNFRHAYYARVRRVDRIQSTGSLAVVSDHVEGTRLSEILRATQSRRLQLDINAAVCLIRQLVPAVALLHENARDASHGLIAPERIIVTPHARLVLVEHVVGSAIEQLQFGRERLWQELRIAMPSSAGMARFDHRADVNGIGVTALSLVLGRPLAADEFPHAVPSLLMQARERSAYGEERPLSNAFRNWLARTLQLDVRRAYASAPEAQAGLEEMLASDPAYVAAPVALETFLSQYQSAVQAPQVQPAITVVPAPVAAPALRAVEPAPVSAFAPPPAWPNTPHAALAPIEPTRPTATPRPIDPVPAVFPIPETPVAISPAPAPSRSIQDLPTLADLLAERDLKRAGDDQAPVLQPVRTPEPAAVVVETAADPDPGGFDDLDSIFGPIVGDKREPASIPKTDSPHSAKDPSAEVEADEAVAIADAAPAPAAKRSRLRLIAAVVAVVAITGGGALAAMFYGGDDAAAPSELGMLVVQSSPAGVEVFVDGVSRGMTPARISLPAGSHILELRGRGVPRVIPLQVPAGGQVSQYLEFADTPMTGMLVVHSQPAGAKVTVDGEARGVAPLTLEGMSPGDHEVVLTNETGTSKHTVKVLAGTTASLVAPVVPMAEGPVSGWVSVKAPFTVEIREDGQLLGTTETDRLMMASGRHVLQFVNQTLGYRESRVVQVAPGKVSTISLDLPKGTISLNASPWAEVFIDGRRVGETPIGNLEVPIGAHEIVFRHPQLGEKRHAVSVTAAAPVRLSVSMK
jgi:hypothetical protein